MNSTVYQWYCSIRHVEGPSYERHVMDWDVMMLMSCPVFVFQCWQHLHMLVRPAVGLSAGEGAHVSGTMLVCTTLTFTCVCVIGQVKSGMWWCHRSDMCVCLLVSNAFTSSTCLSFLFPHSSMRLPLLFKKIMLTSSIFSRHDQLFICQLLLWSSRLTICSLFSIYSWVFLVLLAALL